jgi:hypothetical protein
MGIKDNNNDEFAANPFYTTAPAILLDKLERRKKKLKLLDDALEQLEPGIFKRDVALFIETLKKNISSYLAERELQALFKKVDQHIALINAGICPTEGMDTYPTIDIVDDKKTIARITQKPEQWIIDFEKPPIDKVTLQAELIEMLGYTKYQGDE